MVKELNDPDSALMIYLDMYCFKHTLNVALDHHFREVSECHVNLFRKFLTTCE